MVKSNSINNIPDANRTQNAIAVFGASGALANGGPLTNGQLLIGNTGNAPSAATLTAGSNISITNGAGTISIAASAGTLTYTEITGATQNMAANNAYGANRSGGVAFTLPTTAAIGTELEIVGIAGLWSIAENSGQTIYFGNTNATTTSGTITATNAGDCIKLKCIVADTGFRVTSAVGNLTVA